VLEAASGPPWQTSLRLVSRRVADVERDPIPKTEAPPRQPRARGYICGNSIRALRNTRTNMPAESESESVLATVEDSGPGLDPASLERAFEALYTTTPEGLGMGLSICRSIVEAHGERPGVTANVPRDAIFA
jgi:signal transduction histidine kinase